jgi:hypothetical protein
VGRWIIKPPVLAKRWTTRYSEGEPPNRLHSLNGGPRDTWSILIVSRQRAQGRCFRTFGILKPLRFFADRAGYEKRSSIAKGLLLGAFFCAEGPLRKNTFGKVTRKQIHHEGISRSYNPGSFGMTTCLETKGSTELKCKRPFSP